MAGWFTPFWRQAFICLGVSINFAQCSLVIGYTAGLVPQLKQPGATIHVDDESGSWVASIYGITLILGNIMVGKLMGQYGRQITNILTSVFALAGWLCITLASSLPWLLFGRIVQGISIGFCIVSGPITIGECSSPRNRGFFLATYTSVQSFGSIVIHMMSYYLHWQTCSFVCTLISFSSLLICIYLPESPSWLASQESYENCKKNFRWLRGNDEEDELERLIEASREMKESRLIADQHVPKELLKSKVLELKRIIRKKEVYISLIIAMHLSALPNWSGLLIMSACPNDIIFAIIGKDVNIGLIVMSIDICRFIINSLFIYVVKKIKRKTILLTAVGLNVLLFFIIAGFEYARKNMMFEKPYLGLILLHAHMISISFGALPLPHILFAEILPLEYRSLIGGFSTTVGSVNCFVVIKTFTNLMNNFQICGSYVIYGVICAYLLVVIYVLVPETKDRTLQDIEDEFKGFSKSEDKSIKPFLKDIVPN